MEPSTRSYSKRFGVILTISISITLFGLSGTYNTFGQTTPRTATLDGFATSQRIPGSYTLRISANDHPVTATFYMTNTQTNERSSVVANCVVDTGTQASVSKCVKDIETIVMTKGTYSISARVAYSDGTTVASNQISVNIPIPVPVEVPIVVPVTPELRVIPKSQSKPIPVVKVLSIFGQILNKIRFQNNTAQQQATLAEPIIQELREIAIGLHGGERDLTDATRRLDAIQADLWEGRDMTDSAIQAKVHYQDAKTFGTTVDGMTIQITDIAAASITRDEIASSTTTNAKGQQVVISEKKKIITQKLRVNGKALPNMYATVYVYSATPMVCMAKADRDGNWVCELSEPLPDGSYEAYATISEYTGKVIAKSKRVGFVKNGEVITIEQGSIENSETTSTESTNTPRQTTGTAYWAIAIVVIGMIVLGGVVILVLRVIRRRQNMI